MVAPTLPAPMMPILWAERSEGMGNGCPERSLRYGFGVCGGTAGRPIGPEIGLDELVECNPGACFGDQIRTPHGQDSHCVCHYLLCLGIDVLRDSHRRARGAAAAVRGHALSDGRGGDVRVAEGARGAVAECAAVACGFFPGGADFCVRL